MSNDSEFLTIPSSRGSRHDSARLPDWLRRIDRTGWRFRRAPLHSVALSGVDRVLRAEEPVTDEAPELSATWSAGRRGPRPQGATVTLSARPTLPRLAEGQAPADARRASRGGWSPAHALGRLGWAVRWRSRINTRRPVAARESMRWFGCPSSIPSHSELAS